MFVKERELFSVDTGLDVLISYIGYDLKVVYDRFIEDDKSKDIFLDFENDFLSFDHFYRFTLVKIFKSFIRTKRVILTIGQLVKYLKMIDFDKEIVNEIKQLNISDEKPAERFSAAWDVILSLVKKIGVKRIVIANFQCWKKSSINKYSECEKTLYYILRQLKNTQVRVIVETKDKNAFKNILEDQKNEYFVCFDDHGIVEDFYFYEYYGELDLCIERKDVSLVKDKIRLVLERHLADARGGNQLMYVAFLLALSGQNGMNTTSLSSLLGVTAGACGSVLKRLLQAGVVKKIDKNYMLKNNSFRKIIMENY